MIRNLEIFPQKSAPNCQIRKIFAFQEPKHPNIFVVFFLFFILERKFCPKNVHIDELKHFVYFLVGPSLMILGVILAFFVDFSTNFRRFNLSFFGRSDNKSFVTKKIHLDELNHNS